MKLVPTFFYKYKKSVGILFIGYLNLIFYVTCVFLLVVTPIIFLVNKIQIAPNKAPTDSFIFQKKIVAFLYFLV